MKGNQKAVSTNGVESLLICSWMIGLIKDHESKILPIQIRRINLVDQSQCFLKVVSSKPGNCLSLEVKIHWVYVVVWRG